MRVMCQAFVRFLSPFCIDKQLRPQAGYVCCLSLQNRQYVCKSFFQIEPTFYATRAGSC